MGFPSAVDRHSSMPGCYAVSTVVYQLVAATTTIYQFTPCNASEDLNLLLKFAQNVYFQIVCQNLCHSLTEVCFTKLHAAESFLRS